MLVQPQVRAYSGGMAAAKVFGIVLAGGEGKRLMPLTADRAKPAVPFAGGYRLVDFALSNLINSGLRQVVVLNEGTLVEPDMLPPPLNRNSPAPATMRPAAPTAPATDLSNSDIAQPSDSQDMAHLAAKIRPMAEIEREVIESAIDQCDGNIRKAAALLGISAPTIYRKKAVWDEA